MYRFGIFSILFFSVFSVSHVSAQIGAPFLTNTATISFSKEIPEKGDTIFAFVESNTIDMDRARVTWFIDGVQQKKLGGKERFSFTVPQKTQTTISVSVETGDGARIETERLIQPQSLTLLWQADSFVPLFYKGKRKLPYEGKVTFTPIGTIRDARGVTIPPENLVYKWKRNGTVLGSLSGLGKNILVLKGDIIGREFDIELVVSSRTGEALAITGTYVEPTTIETIIYRDDPLKGLDLSFAGNRGILTSDVETHFFVMPFFASVFRTGDARVETVWTINTERAESSGPWDLRVEQDGSRVIGTISASARNTPYDLQEDSTSIPVFFRGIQTQSQ